MYIQTKSHPIPSQRRARVSGTLAKNVISEDIAQVEPRPTSLWLYLNFTVGWKIYSFIVAVRNEKIKLFWIFPGL